MSHLLVFQTIVIWKSNCVLCYVDVDFGPSHTDCLNNIFVSVIQKFIWLTNIINADQTASWRAVFSWFTVFAGACHFRLSMTVVQSLNLFSEKYFFIDFEYFFRKSTLDIWLTPEDWEPSVPLTYHLEPLETKLFTN